MLADSIASYRIHGSHCIASAPSAAAGTSAGDWPEAPDKRFVRDAGRNWSKGGSVSTARKKRRRIIKRFRIRAGFKMAAPRTNEDEQRPNEGGQRPPATSHAALAEMRPGGASTSSGGQSKSGGCLDRRRCWSFRSDACRDCFTIWRMERLGERWQRLRLIHSIGVS